MTATIKNTVANVADALFAGAMTSSKEDSNRQAKLVAYMFASPSFNDANFLSSYITAKGETKTDIIDRSIRQMSDTYAATFTELETLADKKGRSKQENFKLDDLKRQVNAARAMFKRCASSVYYLTQLKATDVTVRKDGTLNVTAPDKDGDVEVNQFSGRALTLAGDKRISEALGKAPKAAVKPANVNVTESMLNTFTGATKLVQALPNGLDDLSDEPSKAAHNLLLTLLKSQFSADGSVDSRDIVEYLRDAGITVDGKKPVTMTAAKAEAVRKSA